LAIAALTFAPSAAGAQEVLILEDGRRIEVNWLARRDGQVVFQTTGGDVFSVRENAVESPPLDQIPATTPVAAPLPVPAPPAASPESSDGLVLRLRDGREIRVLQVVRRAGQVLFQTSGGDRFSVPEDQVLAPPLDEIAFAEPQLLRLQDGREIRVLRIGRRDGLVIIQTADGDGFSVPEAQVVAPPLDQIPVVGGPAPTLTPEAPVIEATPSTQPEVPTLPRPPTPDVPDFVPWSDRWAVPFPDSARIVKAGGADPYNTNVLKGDAPIIGDKIFVFINAIFDTPIESRRTPLLGNVSTAEPGSFEFFGRGEQFFATPRILLQTELFKGQTAFKPKKWALRLSPALNFNTLSVKENNNVNVDVREGPRTRPRWDVSLEEAFFEYEVLDFEPYYDSVSVRAGIQPFVSDFRGLIFSDFNLGVRAFGFLDNNKLQFNLAYFDLLEKETNSGLNTFDKRAQDVFIANVYRQDFLTKGYQIQGSFHWSRDRDDVHYDENGVLVRPAPVGSPSAHEVTSQYVGIAGDGHIGRLNLSHAFYWAFGTDERNVVAGQEIEIDAQFAALELSVDKDWARLKASVLFASGDADPRDELGTGFDVIYDRPNFAGGDFSFWNRSAILLTQTKVLLKPQLTLLPTLRSNKFEGQANFVNPGLMLAGIGADIDVAPKLRLITSANYLRFHRTESLEQLLFQPDIDTAIGIDLGAGVFFRPFLNENLSITAGMTGLLPGTGFKNIYSSEPCGTPGCGAESQNLYNIFALVRVIW
jgi:hypothetical protein